MALNPPLNQMGEPCRVEGELFVMKRKAVEFEFKVQNGSKYSGKGIMILTTARIVCLNQKNSAFKAFDLPLALTYNESFEQPIFGANYIKGTCKPLLNLPGDVNFKIWFMEGGCGTFAPAYLKMVHSMRVNRNRGIDQKLQNNIASGNYGKTAYVDPNDPSIIYLQQPQVVQNINYNPFGYQPIPQQPIQQQPMYQQPVQQQPMYQQPMQQPMYQQPVQQPMYQQPMQQPMYQQPMQQPMYQQPMQQQPMQQQPMQQQPYMMSQPVSNQNSQLSNQEIMQQREAYYNKQVQNSNEYQQPQQINNQNPYPVYDNNLNNNNINNNINNNPSPVNEYPSMEQVIGGQNQNLYPQADNVQVLNNVNIQQGNGQNNQQKYFGFFGPSLEKKNN